MDRTTFLDLAPEFKTARVNRVDAALAVATLRTDAGLFGTDALTIGAYTLTVTDAAIFYLAAHILTASPSGKAARLEGGDIARTLYLDERERLEREAGCCLGVSLVADT